MENLRLRKAAPTSVNVTVGRRSREYLTDREVDRLIEAAKQNRSGHRDATAILIAYRHGLRGRGAGGTALGRHRHPIPRFTSLRKSKPRSSAKCPRSQIRSAIVAGSAVLLENCDRSSGPGEMWLALSIMLPPIILPPALSWLIKRQVGAHGICTRFGALD
jgi:hypothetical protein